MAPAYVQVRSLLLKYLSPILVDAVLQRAMTKRAVTAHALTSAELNEIAADIMVGLRLFVAERDLPSLMVGLAEILEREMP